MTRYRAVGRSDAGVDLFKDRVPKKVTDHTQDTLSAVLVGEHGRYQIKSGRLAGEYVARAFPKPPTNARGMIAEAKGATEEAAIAALQDVIDARETRRTEERRTDPQTGSAVPSTEEYVEAIGQIVLSRPQRAMLMALSLANGDGLTEMRMAKTAGYKSPTSANRSLAGAGRLIANYLSAKTAANSPSNGIEGTSFLGFRGERRTEEEAGNWILHSELREAIRCAL